MYVIEDIPVYFVDGDCVFDASPTRLSAYNDWCVYVYVFSAYSNAKHTGLCAPLCYICTVSDGGVESAVYSDNAFTNCEATEIGVVRTILNGIQTRYVMGLVHAGGQFER